MKTPIPSLFFKVLLSILISLLIINPIDSYSQTRQSATNKYQQQKNQIQASIDGINSAINERGKTLTQLAERKSTLQAEIATIETNIQSLDKSITEAKLTQASLDKQIKDNKAKQDQLYEQMEILVPEIQKESKKTGVQAVLESENIAELMRRVFGLSTFQVELESINKQLERLNEELNQSLEQQKALQITLENTYALVQIERNNLQDLLTFTQGEEARYQQLIADLNAQKASQKAQEKEAEIAYQAELAKITAEEARQASLNSGGNNQGGVTRPGGTPIPPSVPGNCYFEEGSNLGRRLSRPAVGVLTDNYGCPSWTGRNHDGIDIANVLNSDILASYSGVVEKKSGSDCNFPTRAYYGGFGCYIILRHNDGDKIFYTLYAHLHTQPTLAVGQSVSAGERIGFMGCTGMTFGSSIVEGKSCGIHLHFMIISQSYQATGAGCVYGSSKCYNPMLYTNL